MGACVTANPVPGVWTAEEPQQGGAGIFGRRVQQVQNHDAYVHRPWKMLPKQYQHQFFTLYICVPAEPSVFREVSPPPKLRASALIWSLKSESITGLPTGEKRKPSGRSWPWTPSLDSPTASTLCCHTVHHIIPRPALRLPVRCPVTLLCLQFSITEYRRDASWWQIFLC